MNNNENDHRPAGLLLDVYRAHRLGDCTNGGISAAADTLLLVGVLDERRARTGRITSLPSGCTPTEREATSAAVSGSAPPSPYGFDATPSSKAAMPLWSESNGTPTVVGTNSPSRDKW